MTLRVFGTGIALPLNKAKSLRIDFQGEGGTPTAARHLNASSAVLVPVNRSSALLLVTVDFGIYDALGSKTARFRLTFFCGTQS